ncbi:MAG: BMP family ABC transporter substrate-binding protein [Ilumatobacteraceae bacterium]
MRKSKRFSALALVAGLAITAAACGSDKKTADTTAATTTAAAAATTAAGTTPTSLDGSKVTACEVTDTGGVDDKGFNQNAHEGILDAEKEYGIKGDLLESKTASDYAPNLTAFVAKKCSIIVSVGFLLAPDTATVAKANPDLQFAIVDSDANDDNGTPKDATDDKNLANVRALLFSTEQPSYLAGYLAAGMSKSGKVATYGGVNIPSVTSFMSGYLEGVNKYNEVHGTKVTVLGWDGKDGSFTNDFQDASKGKNLTQGFADEGADIVFPVAGPVGLGTSAYAKENPGKIRVIGVDVDQFVSNSQESAVYLTSVIKKIDAAVQDSIKNVIETGKVGADYQGTLKNGGLDLAPYHDQEKDVPTALQGEITQLKQDIIDGKITVTP